MIIFSEDFRYATCYSRVPATDGKPLKFGQCEYASDRSIYDLDEEKEMEVKHWIEEGEEHIPVAGTSMAGLSMVRSVLNYFSELGRFLDPKQIWDSSRYTPVRMSVSRRSWLLGRYFCRFIIIIIFYRKMWRNFTLRLTGNITIALPKIIVSIIFIFELQGLHAKCNDACFVLLEGSHLESETGFNAGLQYRERKYIVANSLGYILGLWDTTRIWKSFCFSLFGETRKRYFGHYRAPS